MASGKLALTASALAPARRLATPQPSRPSAASACLMAASSIGAGTTSKARPAACNSRRRCGLAEPKISGATTGTSVIVHPRFGLLLLSIVQQPNDGSGGFLHRAARHIDDGPAVAAA